MSCIREELSLSNWQGKGPRVPLQSRYAPMANRQFSTFGSSSRLYSQRLRSKQSLHSVMLCLSLTRDPPIATQAPFGLLCSIVLW
jgi:hypothetical protein